MSRRRPTLLLIGLLAATPVLAAEAPAATGAATAEALPTLAVLEFAAKGGVSQDAVDALADLVASEVLKRGAHKVIGKADIKSLLGYEKIKDALGCEEASCLAEIGGALGVDLILVGNVSQFDEVFLLNLRLIDPKKAEVGARVSRKVPGGQAALLDAVSPAVGELFGDAPAVVFGAAGVLGGLGILDATQLPAPAAAALASTAPQSGMATFPQIDRPTDLVELEELFETDLGGFYATWLNSAQRRKGLSFDGYMLEAAHEQAKAGIGSIAAGCGLLATAGGLVPVVVLNDDNDLVVGLVSAGIIVAGLFGVIALPMGAAGYVRSQDAIEKLTPRVEQRSALGPAAERPQTWRLSYRIAF